MAFANSTFPERKRQSSVPEKSWFMRWISRLLFKTSKPSSFTSAMEPALEDEIYTLRMRMEQMYSTEQSLTAPLVVEISTLLDQKINQWMQLEKSQSR